MERVQTEEDRLELGVFQYIILSPTQPSSLTDFQMAHSLFLLFHLLLVAVPYIIAISTPPQLFAIPLFLHDLIQSRSSN